MRRLVLTIALACITAFLTPPTGALDVGVPQADTIEPGERLVGFYELPEDRDQYAGEPVLKVDEELRFFVVESDEPVLLHARAQLDERVKYIEPNRDDWQLHFVPNDPFYPHAAHWGTKRIGAEAAWDVTTGSSAVKVAHIDSGLNKGHEDIARYLQGFDFNGGDNNPDDTNGCNYHGTHTTGTAGSPINNGLGFAGVSGQHTILPVKIFGGGFMGCGTTTTAIVDALKYAADQGAHLSSNSWGGGGFSSAIDDAITYAHNKGVIHVASAGNSGPCSNCVGEPWRSAGDRSIVVTSLTDGDTFSGFSSQGPQVDVIAPGDFIGAACSGTSDYCGMSGTSMAAPHVTGALALYLAVNPGSSFSQVMNALGSTSENLGFSSDRQGLGLVRADNLVAGGGGGNNNPPTASFTFSCTDLACSFDASGSSDSDGSISSYSWDFGDGNTGSGATVSHTFAASGTYTVTLTVTDNEGATGSSSQDVSVSDGGSGGGIALDVTAYKVQGRHHFDLTWSGASSTNVDVYRNGALVATTANDGAYTDPTNNRGGGSYTHQVCEAGTSTCSNVVTSTF